MTSLGEPPAGRDSGSMADVRAEALDVVLDALQWRLAEARWQAIEQMLIAMEAALEAGAVEDLAAATADLELAGPLRITRIGSTPLIPPGPPIRDLLNRMVYSLGGMPADQEGPEQAGADDHDTSAG
jgi:hypothetical protein